MVEGTRLDYSIIAQPYSPDKDEYIAVLHPAWTTANFADEDHRVNTQDKFLGRIAWDTTLDEPRFASGPAAADAWELMAQMLARVTSAAFLFPTATTAELVDEADAINTTNKRAGKVVWDSTLGQPVWADGAGVNDTWSLATGVVSTTPA